MQLLQRKKRTSTVMTKRLTETFEKLASTKNLKRKNKEGKIIALNNFGIQNISFVRIKVS